MPSGRVLELTQMGGVDSVSNPLASNPKRSLRCQNWCPQRGGFLKQRYGFSTATYFGAYRLDNTGCHSAFYFDIDEEATGSLPTFQGSVIAIGPHVDVISLQGTPTATRITDTADGDPFQVFVADNKLYIPCGDPNLQAGNADSLTANQGAISTAHNSGSYAAPVDTVAWGTGSTSNIGSTVSYSTVSITEYNFPFSVVPTWSDVLLVRLSSPSLPSTAIVTGFGISLKGYKTGGTDTVYVDSWVTKSNTRAGGIEAVNLTAGTVTALSFGGQFGFSSANVNVNELNSGVVGVALQVGVPSNPSPQTIAIFLNSLVVTIYYYGASAGDTWFTDGVTARRSGIRAPLSTEANSVTVSESNTVTGTFGSTTLSGYQFYMSYYNPITGHVGNRVSIGNRLTISGTQSSVVISGLPDLSAVNEEWVKLIGRTADNGQIPYACDLPVSGTWVVVGNSSTIGTLTSSSIDYTSELPIRNGTPPLMHKCATALGRVYAIDDYDPTKIIYSESASDQYGSSNFVGLPPQSWDPNSRIVSRTAETFRAIQSVNDEIWGFTRNYLSIITEFGLYSPDGNPSPYIRGTWPGGCCGQRAFCQTPYGPFWLNAQKQLMTRGEGGPTVVSGEYESALLSNFISAQLDTVEMIYYRDPSRFIDRIYITGQATVTGGSTYYATIVHDFAIGGQGYEYHFDYAAPNLYMRDPTHTFSFRDSNQDFHLVFLQTGSAHDWLHRMEDGSLSDELGTITSDLIGVVNVGVDQPTFRGLDISGDSNLVVTHWTDLTLSLASITALTADMSTVPDSRSARFHVDFEEGSQFVGIRMRLTSHPSDAPSTGLDDGPIPHLPLEQYGRVLIVRSELGVGRHVGGEAP